MADIKAELDQEWAEFLKERAPSGKKSQAENWRNWNPGEWSKLKAYHDGGGPRPQLVTNMGRQMVYHTAAWLAVQGQSPTPVPPKPTKVPAFFDPYDVVVSVPGNLMLVEGQWYSPNTFIKL